MISPSVKEKHRVLSRKNGQGAKHSQWLKALKFFRELFRNIKPGDCIELRCIGETDDKFVEQKFFHDRTDFLEEINDQPENVHLYFGVQPRIRQGGKAEDVGYAIALYVDLDLKDFKGGKEEARRCMKEFPILPTVIINSGHGFHAYWFLEIPESDLECFRDTNRRLQQYLRSDPVDDLPRVMRVPGSINYKSKPVQSEIIQADYSLKYSLQDFDNVLPKLTRNSKKLTRIPKGKRNATLFKRGVAKRASGFNQNEINEQLKNDNENFCDPPTTESEVAGISKSAASYPIGDSDPGLIKHLADSIQRKNHFAQDTGGELYVFKDGVYKPNGKEFVKRMVPQRLEVWSLTKKWSSRLGDETAEYIRLSSPQLWEQLPLNILNVKNGILDVQKRKLTPHTPDHLSSVQLPVVYDPKAKCPEWDAFIDSTFPKDSKSVAYEIIALLMRPDTSIQKAIILIGTGANGKSRFLKAVTEFLGEKNVTALSPHKLESDKFASARLVGKLANICSDLPAKFLQGSSVFKAITGGDTIPAERKYQSGFEFVPFCRLVFSANHLPKSVDSSEAFFRRWIVIPFDRTFSDGKQGFIPSDKLDARLADPRELSGVLNKALRVLAKGSKITESRSMRKAAKEFRRSTDPVSVWLDAATIIDPQEEVSIDELFRAYQDHSEKHKLPTITKKAFGSALRRYYPNIEKKQRGGRKNQKWYYIGIGLKEENVRAGMSTPYTR